MQNAIYSLLPQLAATMSTFSKLGEALTKRLLDQLNAYGNLSDGQASWMRLKAYAIPVTVMLGEASKLGKGLYPKSSQPLHPHIQADGFMSQLAINIAEKLRDNTFMRSSLKTASMIIPSVGRGAETLIDSRLTQSEAKRSVLTQVDFQKAIEGQSAAQNMIEKASQLANSIIEKKSRGG